ncbi:MAG TPA: sigma-70 family RNA polymerase sigma factor [Candidatus Krumholzibacteria bacterium]|jgi:RNA polymerase sigma-70 factor (ECF subfamily)
MSLANVKTLDPDRKAKSRQEMSDEELMLRVQAGEKSCYDILVTRYKVRLYNYLLRMVSDPDVAEEIAQDAFVRAYINAEKYRTIARFSTWLYTIATNLVRNRYRKKKRTPLILSLFFKASPDGEELVHDIADDSPNPEQLAIGSDLERLIAEATEKIPERYREPFLLREVNQLSYEEIRAVTGLKLGTVRSRINRARTHFRKIIGPQLVDPVPGEDPTR